MKKIIILAIIAVFSFTAAKAQSYGIKGGVNFANLSGSDAEGFDSLTGFHLGVTAEFSIFQNLSLQPELVYSVQGAKLEDTDYKLGYLTLPVMVKFYLNDKLSIHAGPQFGLLVSESDEVKENDNNTTDYGISAGIEYKIIGGLFAQARYNSGLSEISDNAEVKNTVFQLSLGYQF